MKGLFLLVSIVVLAASCDNAKPITEVIEDSFDKIDLDSPENIELGRKLFFDSRLSIDKKTSCSSCHLPEFAFSDRMQFSEGVNGHFSSRNSPSILNSKFLERLMFDAEIKTLEEQALVPIQDTNELGMVMSDLIQRLISIPEYQNAAQSIYNRDFDAYVLTRSLAAYQRSLLSMNSRFDKAERGELARSAEEERGWKLFSEDLYCTKCHPAPYFTTFKADNNGLLDDYTLDEGRFRIDFDSSEIGFFKIPSLRNVELTYPYMHDGSLKSLGDVLSHYASGGSGHPNKSEHILPFNLSKQDGVDLKAFLYSITDTSYLLNASK